MAHNNPAMRRALPGTLAAYEPDPTDATAALGNAADMDEWVGGDRVDIDDCFASPFEEYLGSLGTVDPQTMRVVRDEVVIGESSEGATVLLAVDPRGESAAQVIGYYYGPTVAIRDDYQGIGLGTTLIAEAAMRDGGNPQQWCDKVGYSYAGYAAHCRAYEHLKDLSVQIEKQPSRLGEDLSAKRPAIDPEAATPAGMRRAASP